MIGMAIAKGLDEHGQPGATHMSTSFDSWYPGYIDYAPVFKNIPAFWTETAGNMATPREYTINDFPQNYRDLRPQSLYSSPWPAGWWRLADAVAYDETASFSTLEWAAKYKESLLYNRYQAGRDQIAKGKKGAPYAYFVPQDQRDPVVAVELLRRLAFAGVRVSQLTAPATSDNVSYPAGTWVIPADQEFAALAREVLDVQNYPDLRQYPGGPPERPYDAAGWTLPLQMGVKVAAASTPLADETRAKMKLLRHDAGSEGQIHALQPDGIRKNGVIRECARHRLQFECRGQGHCPAAREKRRAAVRRLPLIPRRTMRFAPSIARGSKVGACSSSRAPRATARAM